MARVLVEDRIGFVDTQDADRRRATLEFATDLWDCRDEVISLFRGGFVEILWDIAKAQPTASFAGGDYAAKHAKLSYIVNFVRGNVDEWEAAGALLYYKENVQRSDAACA